MTHNRTRWLVALATVMQFSQPWTAFGQVSFDSLTAKWERGSYDQVLKPLVELRQTAPQNEWLTLDFMIATSNCRGTAVANRKKGVSALDAMLRNYGRTLTAAQQATLRAERTRCAAAVPPPRPSPKFVALSSNRRTEGATYTFGGGKTFYWVCQGRAPVSSGRKSAVLTGTISQRVWPLSDIDQAEDSARARLAAWRSTGKVVARDGIAMVSTGSHTTAQLDSILDDVRLYRDFFAHEYGLRVPAAVLHVYLAPNESALHDMAFSLHGMRPDYDLIGYSVLSDYTIVALIPGRVHGTVMHELMHMLFSENLGAAPPWLEEGLAALYEVSRVRSDRVVGLPNWRGEILRRYRARWPTLQSLFEMDWDQFEAFDKGTEWRAVNHAFARYFVLYLQQQGKLSNVVTAMTQRPSISYTVADTAIGVATDDGASTLGLVANVLGVAPAQLNARFTSWLQTTLPTVPEPCR